MKTLVVYDSVFGNTQKVAEAAAAALPAGPGSEVVCVRVGDLRPEQLTGVELFIAGSPTRGFRPTPALQQCLAGLPAGSLQGVRTAAFDTRIPMDGSQPGFLRVMVRLFGYAAAPIAKALAQKGGVPAAPPEGFIVLGSEGPLKDGELERAAEWARRLAQAG
jgi:flavodoxin